MIRGLLLLIEATIGYHFLGQFPHRIVTMVEGSLVFGKHLEQGPAYSKPYVIENSKLSI